MMTFVIIESNAEWLNTD